MLNLDGEYGMRPGGVLAHRSRPEMLVALAKFEGFQNVLGSTRMHSREPSHLQVPRVPFHPDAWLSLGWGEQVVQGALVELQEGHGDEVPRIGVHLRPVLDSIEYLLHRSGDHAGVRGKVGEIDDGVFFLAGGVGAHDGVGLARTSAAVAEHRAVVPLYDGLHDRADDFRVDLLVGGLGGERKIEGQVVPVSPSGCPGLAFPRPGRCRLAIHPGLTRGL
mmetsp:Transcript_44474/g.117595  ORF Transcript_44474/g.117595 Transcript_44474/m.117595 type:complete len:219 (+) Transcript_44474:1627-2283(+)